MWVPAASIHGHAFMNHPGLATTPTPYRVVLAGFMSSLALTLLALLDIRRGFLFADYPIRTLFYVLAPWHGLMLATGASGMFVFHRRLRSWETHLPDTPRLVRTL